MRNVKIILLENEGQDTILTWYRSIVQAFKSPIKFEEFLISVDGEEFDRERICQAFSNGAMMILDLTWTGNDLARTVSMEMDVPYLRIDVSLSPFFDLLHEYLNFRNSTDVALIFDDPSRIDQAIYYWIDNVQIAMSISESLDAMAAKKLRDFRPTPNSFAIFAETKNMEKMFKIALEENLVTLPERWNLVFLDFHHKSFDRGLLKKMPVNLLTLDAGLCCQLLNLNSYCECPSRFNTSKMFLKIALNMLVTAIEELFKDDFKFHDNIDCDSNFTKDNEESVRKTFEEVLNKAVGNDNLIRLDNSSNLRLKTTGSIEIGTDVGTEVFAKYENEAITALRNKIVKPIKAFYRVGITHALPWSYQIKDPVTKKLVWTGYCVDFTAKLAEKMNFDYELVEPKKGTFGKKHNGVWDGVVGDLASGQTDLAITALIMTADKEEVIDFVAPYFEQTGITIVMRKPVRKTSLFKFMTVLKLEVWLSIVAALIVTGFMVWFLDKYSPYSARNNKKAYPYPCRKFTLKESFWFALTSFTPQGGGEAPKALSGRTLVAAYWLFVVLMLATFTANLAAFLTVERMQAPVQSLEQLARQSRINYTVVSNSQTHKYFINMKFAEDTLYRMWKELTLNASTDDSRYRVWDYPIREQYGHILLAINDSNPVANAEEGFKNVNEHLDADYAFIHDSSEIKYEISRNCNLTEVGEVFAEKPYAVAVQQGSHLQDGISKMILLLQKDRFFEGLQAKYWNNSVKGDCPNTDDNEGITLESLGGVFIATLFGLALAMITLAGEVLYYRRKRKTKELNIKQSKVFPEKPLDVFPPKPLLLGNNQITIGNTFKPVNLKEKIRKEREAMKISHISLYPRARKPINPFEIK
uniref:Ionotropic receptor 8a n=1 Tax=Colaphellus bowringi TaxID=561076 RepID=A0A0S3J2N6_9CUCU|nr:ionotropic receptor 8a [Colaphellus bowringi]